MQSNKAVDCKIATHIYGTLHIVLMVSLKIERQGELMIFVLVGEKKTILSIVDLLKSKNQNHYISFLIEIKIDIHTYCIHAILYD